MSALHESTDYAGESELPKGWEEDVFRYCTFSDVHVEGKAFGGILSCCTLTDSSWYWGLFNTTTFVEVTFRNCVFRGSGFGECLFAKCSFEGCRFIKDNLNGGCWFSDCSWFNCEQTSCEGLPLQLVPKHQKRGR
jgi:uncharacterized protein YjbI with pentapeptide repeats